jgi:hypothetical protein
VDENALRDLGFSSKLIRTKFLKLLSQLISEQSVSESTTFDPGSPVRVKKNGRGIAIDHLEGNLELLCIPAESTI